MPHQDDSPLYEKELKFLGHNDTQCNKIKSKYSPFPNSCNYQQPQKRNNKLVFVEITIP